MNDSTQDPGQDPGAPASIRSAAGRTPEAIYSDYRIREVEVRLARRLEEIESQTSRRSRTLRVGGGALVLTVLALAVAVWNLAPGDGAWMMDSLSTEEIVLRDVDGIERGRLAIGFDGRSELTLGDREGRERIRLTVLADGSPGVTISDPDSRPRAVLGYLPDGTTTLVFADEEGTSRAVFGLERDGSSQALFADRWGAIRTVVGVGANGEPSVSVFEELAGEEVAQEEAPAP